MPIANKPNKQYAFPLPVQRALRMLGSDIRDARRRRRIPTALLAEFPRAFIDRQKNAIFEYPHFSLCGFTRCVLSGWSFAGLFR